MISRKFQSEISIDNTLERTFKVRLFDTDGLKVMTASKHPVYMGFIRWELVARSKLYHAILKRGLAPTLGSQKMIYRKTLKIFTKFKLKLETAGWDNKWVYHSHYFIQNNEIKAIGVTRSLIWKKDIPHILADIIKEAGGPTEVKNPPKWVSNIFIDDKNIIEDSQILAK